MPQWIYAAAFGLLLSGNAQAWGHPGHGETHASTSALHYLLEPIHAGPGLMMLLAVAVILCLWKAVCRFAIDNRT